MSEGTSYGFVSRLNHWVIAAAMIGMLGFGFYLGFADLPREVKGPLMGLHKAMGVLVLIYGLWRVGWRLVQGFPVGVGEQRDWRYPVAMIMHVALLLGIILMPVSGIVASIFHGRPVAVFGLFTIPAQAEVAWLASFAGGVHSVAGIALSILVAVHLAAALQHHFVDRDTTLTRMLRG
jgi:cytochrome b561